MGLLDLLGHLCLSSLNPLVEYLHMSTYLLSISPIQDGHQSCRIGSDAHSQYKVAAGKERARCVQREADVTVAHGGTRDDQEVSKITKAEQTDGCCSTDNNKNTVMMAYHKRNYFSMSKLTALVNVYIDRESYQS